MRFPVVILFVLLVAGCTTVTGGFSILKPGTWFQGRAAAAVVKEENKQATQEDKAVDAAQTEVMKTGLALKTAPASRPVEVATRTNANAAALLNQRKPVSAATMAEINEVVTGLLSESAEARNAAESKQTAAEGQLRELSRDLEATRAKLIELHAKRDKEAAENLALANELRNQVFLKWAGFTCSALMAAAAFAYRMNLGNLQTGVANGLAHLQHKYGSTDEDVAAVKTEIDTLTGKGQQKAIFGLVTTALYSKS